MQDNVKYTLIPTRWGFFGLAAIGDRIYRTALPNEEPDAVADILLKDIAHAQHKPNLLRPLQMEIVDYFEGVQVDFAKYKLFLAGKNKFTRDVLNACRNIEYGRTATYANIAADAGSPQAARAVGRAMAANNLPLIVPCHRVVGAGGGLGGFSAGGGISTKKKMLSLEGATIAAIESMP